MARENRGVMKNNLFLYLTEFFAGPGQVIWKNHNCCDLDRIDSCCG